jgi:hypothetical protein
MPAFQCISFSSLIDGGPAGRPAVKAIEDKMKHLWIATSDGHGRRCSISQFLTFPSDRLGFSEHWKMMRITRREENER